MNISLHKPYDAIAGGLFILIGAGGAWIAAGYPLGTAMRMGAGYFPTLVGVCLALLGLLVLLRSLSFSRAEREEVGDLFSIRPALFIGGSVVAFALLVPSLGLLLATVVMTVISGYARRKTHLGELAGISAALACFGVLVFAYGLGLHLPVLPV